MSSFVENLSLSESPEWRVSRSLENDFNNSRSLIETSSPEDNLIFEEKHPILEEEEMFHSMIEDNSLIEPDRVDVSDSLFKFDEPELNSAGEMFMSFTQENEIENQDIDYSYYFKEKDFKNIFSGQVLKELLMRIPDSDNNNINMTSTGIDSLNVSVIFSDPENTSHTIEHKEVVNGCPSKEFFRKPFGWTSETIITYNGDGDYHKLEITYVHLFINKEVNSKKYRRNIINGHDRISGVIVGSEREGENPNPKSKLGLLKFSTKVLLTFSDQQSLEYQVLFNINEPSKCCNQ